MGGDAAGQERSSCNLTAPCDKHGRQGRVPPARALCKFSRTRQLGLNNIGFCKPFDGAFVCRTPPMQTANKTNSMRHFADPAPHIGPSAATPFCALHAHPSFHFHPFSTMQRKLFGVFLLLAIAVARAVARQNPNKGAPNAKEFPDWAAAIQAANTTAASLTTLIAAVEAAGVASALNSTTAWTMLGPVDEAFAKRLKEDLDITPAQLLLPANRETLVKVLSYHVIPAGALTSSTLTNGQMLTTALASADPLRVLLQAGKKPRFVGATNSATLVAADVKVGASVVHVVNDVLLPSGIGKGQGKRGGSD